MPKRYSAVEAGFGFALRDHAPGAAGRVRSKLTRRRRGFPRLLQCKLIIRRALDLLPCGGGFGLNGSGDV